LEPALEVLQGGGIGYNSGFYYISKHPPINDDYDRPNARGTIAMAKTSAPNSTTNQFYFNLKDVNAGTLAPNPPFSTGYMVFGYVIGDGMDAVDDLAGYGANPLGVDIQDHGSPLNTLPLIPSEGFLYFEWLQSVSVVGVEGDTDFDGDVDLDDLNQFSASFGDRGIGLAADFDGDYDVDLDDFAVFQANYAGPVAPPAAPGAPIPEPTSICLLGLCGMGMIARRRRKS
jgi:cyclophilin family peptidyl-prolyl cis-trans isomerase